MDAATLNCPMCGAPCASDATRCEHCQARLATVACPSCFGLIFLGSKFCPHCGAAVERTESAEPVAMSCPRCRVALNAITLGTTNVDECPKCEGLWVGVSTFNSICADRDQQAAVFADTPAPAPEAAPPALDETRYLPCAVCGDMMNRMNFANHSGIIIDLCKPHGIWFDRDELRRIIEYIRAGGLTAARARDLEKWQSEKRVADFSRSLSHIGRSGVERKMSDIPSTHWVDYVADAVILVGRMIWGFFR